METTSTFDYKGYLVSPEETFTILVRNTYDETLNGFGDFKGLIEITWARNPLYKKTIPFDKSTLTENRRYKYDGANNILTMDPSDEMSFRFRWRYDTNDSLRIDSLFELHVDPACYKIVSVKRGKRFANIFWNPRKFAKEIFYISGYIKPFSNLAAVVIPRQSVMIEYETFSKSDCQSLPNPY
ncbi:MAG: hypothetical protein HYV29_03210 [Ignavibacteriales bacterium]|nr:hypothetical protein [Ignavibacteriales bacterium]